MNCMLGPAILVTVGILMLLDNAHRLSLHHSWPIILIVIGSIKVLQTSASTDGHREPTVPAEGAPIPMSGAQEPGSGASSIPTAEDR